MNSLLLKSSIIAALAALVASSDDVHVHEEQSSLLRGFAENLGYMEKTNRCANRPNPLNCIDCIGGKNACDANTDYSVPYTCDEGQKFCCTVSNIKETDFNNAAQYGQCKTQVIAGSTRSGSDIRSGGDATCVKDGDAVKTDMYKDLAGTPADKTVDSLCCSGKCDDCTCISGTGMDEDGKQWVSGSCSGTCGAKQETVQRTNRCANRKNPLNCIDCIGGKSACDANTDYSVPYTCDEGQKFCCTVSSIGSTDFDKPDKFGECKKGSGGDATIVLA